MLRMGLMERRAVSEAGMCHVRWRLVGRDVTPAPPPAPPADGAVVEVPLLPLLVVAEEAMVWMGGRWQQLTIEAGGFWCYGPMCAL